ASPGTPHAHTLHKGLTGTVFASKFYPLHGAQTQILTHSRPPLSYHLAHRYSNPPCSILLYSGTQAGSLPVLSLRTIPDPLSHRSHTRNQSPQQRSSHRIDNLEEI